MSAVFGPHDRVRCVRAWVAHDPRFNLVVGNVYTIADFFELECPPGVVRHRCDSCGNDRAGVHLAEQPPPNYGRREAHCPCYFAPTWDDDEVPQTVEEINELIGSAMK